MTTNITATTMPAERGTSSGEHTGSSSRTAEFAARVQLNQRLLAENLAFQNSNCPGKVGVFSVLWSNRKAAAVCF
jgi:hypothetical protein